MNTVKYETNSIQATVETITENGIGSVNFQIDMKNLEKWLSDLDVNEPYNDIKDDILDGMETTIHLKKPISTVTLIMPKPKNKDA